MVLRTRLHLPRDQFPAKPWAIETRAYFGNHVQESETVFALANGYLGLRASHEEDHPVVEPGTYLNGFHELRQIVYGESAYGFAKTGQTMLNCPDGKIIKTYVDGEPFDIDSGELASYRRRLDMQRGFQRRQVVWVTPTGKRVDLRTTRLVSLAHRHLACLHLELTVEDADADIVFSSELRHRREFGEDDRDAEDPRMGAIPEAAVLQPAGHWAHDWRSVLSYRTTRSGLVLACGMDHEIKSESDVTVDTDQTDDVGRVVFRLRARAGEPIHLTKYLAYHYNAARPAEDLRAQVGWTLDAARSAGYEELLSRQEKAAADFWEHADVVLEGDPETQQVVRWNLFQLLQASACVDGHGIGARGLTGKTYEGHYFWDTEIYVLPFLIYTNPRVARAVLKFRYDKLDKARERAHELGHRGALFPWRTINGEEASAYYAAGTAQYHINADIMYAMRKYVDATGDVGFLDDFGAEMLVETARLWVDLGYYNPRRGGKFCITGVTGPDEYTAVVNNNYFTNIMARQNLNYAARTLRELAKRNERAYAHVVRTTDLQETEIDDWLRAAGSIFLPYDEERGVHAQDDAFLDKDVWDFAETPADNYPLLLYYHPLNLYRHQVIKQADTLLALFLLGKEFSVEEKRRNFDYYDPLTTHDSSLSVCIQSIIANEIGYTDKALEYFRFAATMDLSDVGGNVRHGAHIASIGGSWMALVYGFGGMRDYAGQLSFEPRVPDVWERLTFHVTVRGNRLRVGAATDTTTYDLLEGDELTFTHCETAVTLSSDKPSTTLPNRAVGA